MSKILIVDDAAFMRMLVKNALARLGLTDVEEASDGMMAVEKYKQLSPDLVILDIIMANLDGIGTLNAIKQINPDAKVVICSAMGQEGIVMEAIKLGALDFIVKPFQPERIAKMIEAVLG